MHNLTARLLVPSFVSLFVAFGMAACGSDSTEVATSAIPSDEDEVVAPPGAEETVLPEEPKEAHDQSESDSEEEPEHSIPGDDDNADEERPAAFPTGEDTPEGAACDLARAFINADADQFLKVCERPLGQGDSAVEYQEFLDQLVSGMKAEREKSEPSPHGPKRLLRVFKARALSLNGPASYGYAVMNLADVKFVDVLTEKHNGETFEVRTLVLQNQDGTWHVLPLPDAYPLLSMGLNDESDSTDVLFEVD